MVLAAALGVAGCASVFRDSAPVRYYALTPLPPAQTSACAVRFGVRPVTVPGYLDRDEIVIERRGTELVMSGGELWAAPLRGELTRTLGESLALRWGGSRFDPHPWRFGSMPPWAVDVAFEQLDPTPGMLNVRARWSIASTREAGPEIASGRFDSELPMQVTSAGATTDSIARATSYLADQIASEARPALAAHEPGCR